MKKTFLTLFTCLTTYSIVGGHPHCMLPESQYPEVEAFIDKFLLGKNVMTNYEIVDKVIQK